MFGIAVPPPGPDVTVCITAYKSGRMIEPTLRSVRSQSYADFRVLISIDGPHEETEAVCRAETDARFEVIVQPSRLGWVGNTNALLDRVATPFFFILPHDDLLGRRYIEALRQELIAHPAAVNAYSDVELFGAARRVKTRPGFDGDFLSRLGAFLNPRSTSWIPWRGLTRSSVLGTGLRMRDNRYAGYASHDNYILGLLCLGPLRRVAETLYYHRDRTDEDSVRTDFKSRPLEERYAARLEHALQCMETVSSVGLGGEGDLRKRRIMLQMLLMDLVASDVAVKSYGSNRLASVDRFLAVAGDLCARMHALPVLGPDLEDQLSRGSNLSLLTAKLRAVEAQQAMAREHFASAEATIASALELDPESGEVHLQNGLLLRRNGYIAEALAAVRKARDALPENPRAALLLADLLSRTGDLETAVAEAQSAIAMRPGWAQAYHDLGVYLAAAGRHAEALAAARLASEANPARFRSRYDKMQERAAAGPAAAGT